MPYIGNQLATQFQAFATQTITGDGSTGYTLDRAVANGKELLVYINNVKQEEGSGKAYTASGTTITFSEAVASTDSCYLVYMGSAQQTVTAPDGSIVSGQIANATLALPSGLTVVGNTGIGTTSPDEILHLKTTADADLGLKVQNDDTQAFCKVQSGGTALYGGNAGVNFVSGGSFATAMNIDSNGHITKPLQPAFLVHPSTDQNNFSINTDVTVVFDSERFDNNSDFASNTFTAPVTGRYQLNLMLRLNSADTAASYYQVKMVTSNDNYTSTLAPNFSSDPNYFPINSSVLADMDANDTFVVKIYQSGGSAQTDISPNSFVSGFLVA
mgnify:CR=1 FL=1